MRTSSSYRALCSHILYRLSAHHGSRCSNRDTRHSRYQTALVLRSSNFAPVRFTFWNAEILSLLIYIRDYQSAMLLQMDCLIRTLRVAYVFGDACFMLVDLAFGYLAASRISVIRHLNAPQNALAEVRPQAESPAVSIVVHSSILCPLLDAMVWHQPWVALLRLDILILCPRTFRVLFSIHAAA